MIFFSMSMGLFAQYPPAVGQEGSTAIYKDSSIFVAWATGCEVLRGPINIMDLQGEVASFGEPSNALGAAEGNSADVVSLGDMGQATLIFDVEIADGDGWDFAVFENSLDDTFLELAFVQVSSDGVFFHCFPAVSLTDEFIQVPTFGELDCSKLNNFAGKYRQGFGTPFDLAELAGTPGLDLQKITHVRIIDAIGCIQNQFASFDSQGHVVNDPWPTAFDMGGFDLDAVGVINTAETGIGEYDLSVSVFPNPFTNRFTVNCNNSQPALLEVYSSDGLLLVNEFINDLAEFDFSDKQPGVYFLKLKSERRISTVKLLKSN
jgi:hypothetical protein